MNNLPCTGNCTELNVAYGKEKVNTYTVTELTGKLQRLARYNLTYTDISKNRSVGPVLI